MSTRKDLSKIVDTSKAQEETIKEEKREQKEKKKVERKTLVDGVEKKKYKRGKNAHTKHTSYATYEGHKLTPNEAKFIDLYIETGNARQSVIEAGYQTKSPGQYAQSLLKKTYISNEIDYRLKQFEDEKIASADEILKFYTKVMRGEETDQFGLEVPIGERIKAANELAKRKIDIVNKVQNGKDTAEVKITLNWDGMKGVTDGTEEQSTD